MEISESIKEVNYSLVPFVLKDVTELKYGHP
jgi:hypothetical protein